MSVKYFVTFKDKKSRDSNVTSGRGKKKPHFLYIFPIFVFFFASSCYVIQKYIL